MEYNQESRNKPIHQWSDDFQQGYQDHLPRKEQSFQQMLPEWRNSHMQKNELYPNLIPYINNSKLNKEPDVSTIKPL